VKGKRLTKGRALRLRRDKRNSPLGVRKVKGAISPAVNRSFDTVGCVKSIPLEIVVFWDVARFMHPTG
jgi:hypothetical protein